jgi:CxxC motif-containing protein (DUF1111 family)
MRTAPLWGVRHRPLLLHDGRTASLSDAILAHDGQARRSRNRFRDLSRTDRGRVIAFLRTL